MTKLRKALSTAIAVATLATAGSFLPATSASAGGYYGPGHGFYGKPYYGQRRQRHCRWHRVPYRWDYYGRPIRWRKVRRCWYG